MIILFIVLLSLITVYFTRLLQRNGMKMASVMVAILYLYLIAWIYAIFILDIAGLGFSETETRISLLHGSNIYHSFMQLTAKMAIIPLPILQAIVVVAVIILWAGFFVAFHGIIEITKAVVKAAKEKKIFSFAWHLRITTRAFSALINTGSIIRLHCRMNC